MSNTLCLLSWRARPDKQRVAFRMARSCFAVALLSFMLCEVDAQTPQVGEPRWQVYAGCASAYLANWQMRQSARSQDMSTMIREQSDDYKSKAVRFYEEDFKVPSGDAAQKVEAYVASNTARFVDMEKAGTLEAFIDACPPD